MGAFDHLKWTYDGAFEQLFGPGRGEFEHKFSKNSNARGIARGGGELKLRFDWYIIRKKRNLKIYVNSVQCNLTPCHIAGFQCHAIQNRSKSKSKSFNRLSPEAEKRKKINMQRLLPRFRSQQFFLCKICGETFYPNL